jgi:hypothetical protein
MAAWLKAFAGRGISRSLLRAAVLLAVGYGVAP